MTIKEYQKEASRTCPDLGSLDLNVTHMDLGIVTEIGEIYDILKKHIAYGKELDLVHLSEETADAMWYIVNRSRLEGEEIGDTIHDDVFGGSVAEFADHLLDYEWLNMSATDQIKSIKRICNYFNLDFEKGLENNINKLKARFPDKFSKEQALNRNLEKERKELEK